MNYKWLQLPAFMLCLALHAATPDGGTASSSPTATAVPGMNKDLFVKGSDEEISKAIGKATGLAVESAIKKAIGPAVDSAIKKAVGPAVDSAISKAIRPEINSAIDRASNRAVDNPTIDEVIQQHVPGFWTYYSATTLGGLCLLVAVYVFFRLYVGGLLNNVRVSLQQMDAKLENIRSNHGRLEQAFSKLRNTYDSIARAVDALEARLPLNPEEPSEKSSSAAHQISEDPPLSDARSEQSSDGVFSDQSAKSAAARPIDNPIPGPQNGVIAPEPDTTRKNLGIKFLKEVQSPGVRDITYHWESFVNGLRQIGAYGRIDSRQVYWDRTASDTFLENQSDTFRDTGWCYLLSIEAGDFLFFPKLVEPARKKDLPHCRITSPGEEPILRAENLVEFIPPKVQRAAEGWVIADEGDVKYR